MPDYNTAIAYFSSRSAAESAIDSLKSAGFQQNQIGVAAAGSKRGFSSGTSESGGKENDHHDMGGAWEKMKNFFSGNTAEPYAGESTRNSLDSNVIAPDTYGSQDVHHSLSGLSVPEDQARYFKHKLGSNNEDAIVTVNAPGRREEALSILQREGGDTGDSAARGDSAAGYDYDKGNANQEDERNIELYGEVLRVHKDRVSRGDVRLHKEVYTTTQTVEVPVTHEELVVERVAANGERGTGTPSFSQEEIRIPLSEERASVDKEAVLRERVHVGKKEVTNVQSFDEQVRNEDLKVDQTDQTTDKIA